jgi:hypothetical protein
MGSGLSEQEEIMASRATVSEDAGGANYPARNKEKVH